MGKWGFVCAKQQCGNWYHCGGGRLGLLAGAGVGLDLEEMVSSVVTTH